MDFQQLNDFFDGSIFPDDYRNNFEGVDEKTRAAESLKVHYDETAMEEESAGGEVVILLLRIFRSAMCGNYITADRLLERLVNLTEALGAKLLRARCAVYSYYIKGLKRVPPCLRFRDD